MGYYKAPPVSKFKAGTRVKAAKPAAAYQAAYNAWRAGAISDFYLGEKSDTDKTVVWVIDGAEFAEKAYADVTAFIDAKLTDAGIVQITAGASWVGYPALTIDYDDGTSLTEKYDGAKVVTDKAGVALTLAA